MKKQIKGPSINNFPNFISSSRHLDLKKLSIYINILHFFFKSILHKSERTLGSYLWTDPKKSKLRLWLGKKYYIINKYYYWYISRTKFAESIRNVNLPFEIFIHKSILLRKLKDVDMWMQYNKITNLEIAIRKINGLIIEPGQTFSYWRQIGRPTAKKGYLSGMILNNGKVINGIGGGLCQLSNLLYWITLHTPLTVIERWRHGYDVFPDVKRDLPFGSGATCAYPNIDLRIKNNTDQKFQLSLKLIDTHLVGRWLSDKSVEFRYEIFEKDCKIESDYRDGYIRSNQIYRKIIDSKNNEEKAEFVTENHAIMMYNPLLENKSKNKIKENIKLYKIYMIQKEQIIKMTWDEYFEMELNILGDKVEKYLKENNVKIDAVVPLLRGGNIPGTYLAYRFNILKILPVQYKYFFENGLAELRQMQKVSEESFKKDAKIIFLLVEGNHCFGTSASYAAKGLKKQFPNCEILYAASNMDYHYQDVVKDAKVSFYGRLQNSCEECSEEECKKLGLDYKKYEIFPWENIDEELTTMKMEQYQFSDMKESKNKSEFCESFDLSDVYK